MAAVMQAPGHHPCAERNTPLDGNKKEAALPRSGRERAYYNFAACQRFRAQGFLATMICILAGADLSRLLTRWGLETTWRGFPVRVRDPSHPLPMGGSSNDVTVGSGEGLEKKPLIRPDTTGHSTSLHSCQMPI